MGLINRAMGVVFGGGGGARAMTEVVGAFRENAEGAAVREAMLRTGAMEQFGREFAVPRRGWFDRFIDGLNRLPRPMMALGVLGLLVSAMVDPIWFASRMQGIALVPEPLWWLLGAIVSFYFGARHQAKGQDFRRSVAETMAHAGPVLDNIRSLEALERGAKTDGLTGAQTDGLTGAQTDGLTGAEPGAPAAEREPNAALEEWRAGRG